MRPNCQKATRPLDSHLQQFVAGLLKREIAHVARYTMPIFFGPLSKHLFVCALLNFLLCSVTFGTFRAAADPTRVQLECGPLHHVIMIIIFFLLFSIPCIVLMCLLFKSFKHFALIIDIYTVTILLCIEVMISSMQLTQY